MNALTRLTPDITTMIRTDHAAVLSTFHKYRPDASPDKKKAIAETICSAIEIHARLEEELFYPELRREQPELVEKSGPEHNEMRRHIASLRATDPASEEFDSHFLDLMRTIIHHVADEETVLLPTAERLMGSERLGEMGLEMTRRRMELAAPRAGDIAVNTVRTHPGLVAGALALLAVGGYLAWRGTSRVTGRKWLETGTSSVRKYVQRPANRLLGYMR